MSKSISQWGEETKNLSKTQLEKYKKAIETLREWKGFANEYDWTGIFIIGAIIESELKRRNHNLLSDR